jgi:large subunit ribosomal protein L21
MKAVVKTGGKQYTVTEGDTLRVEKLTGEVGATINLGEVLSIGEGADFRLGTPTLEGASIKAEILSHGRGKKVIVFKKKRRKGYKKKQGHRQDYTGIRIQEIKS